MRMKLPMILALALAGVVAVSVASAAPGEVVHRSDKPYAVVARWKLGGAGGWDYLAADAAARRLYVSHSDRVIVLDLDSGARVGEIPHTDGVHGIALAPDLGRGFVSNGRADSVTVFDPKTLKTVSEIKVDARNPDAILYDPYTKRVFTFNGRSADATAIDAKTLKPIATIALDGKPEFAVSDGRGRVYVNIEDKSKLAAIDPVALEVVSEWPLADCEDPTGLALDADHRRLFSTCQNERMIVTDATDGRRVAAVPIGRGPDGAAFDTGSGLAFSSNGEGTLTVVHEDDPEHFSVVGSVPTQRSARTVTLDAKTHRLYLSAAELGAAPPATADRPHPRPTIVPDTFAVLVLGR
jgi:DNA-binding beta-propeller fold protein YncE